MQPSDPAQPQATPPIENPPQPTAPVASPQPLQPPVVTAPVAPVSPQPPVYAAPAPQEVPQPQVAVQEAPLSAPEQPFNTSEAPELEPQSAPNDGPTELPEIAPINWQAEEYLQHEKQPLWYIGFGVVVVALMGFAIWLGAWTFAVLVPVMAVALMVYTHRPARRINYAVSAKGLHINDQLHPMGEFKSFGVVQDHDMNALMLIPVKRFRPGLTVYFPAEVGEELVDTLGSYLPMQDLHLDAFDKIIRKLRI